jgi:uncharacterized cupredoxin-like copper-binding protein
MRLGLRTALATITLACGIVVALTACSVFTASGTTSPTVSGIPVTVMEEEYSITLSETAFSPGTYIFTVKNDGGGSHNLFINGPGVDNVATPTLAPGQTAWLVVTLEEGTYELWSNVADNRQAGMDVRITVS